ncbi:MAG TPA: alpha-amylase family glycosyl hydrolase [Candidatus Acidoferrales bacterium]|nr:alpha-amylase family glycosyl hydrolase [Candidatus Acidoferrales bacterium]
MKMLRFRFLLPLAFLFAIFSQSFAQSAAPEFDFSKEKARPVVEWARSGVIYEIWERAFSPAGDFNGITARLENIKESGVTILWLMPVNPIGVVGKKGSIGSPYAVRDYRAVNPAYGTPEDLKRLVCEAHKRDMKVILDVVYNHSAWDNPLVKEHPEFYHQDENGKIKYPQDWTDVAWLDYSNPKLREYMIDVMRYWVKEYDVDGFRADVASFLPTDFWEQARVEVEMVKPSIFMLAEADKPDQMVKAFDSDYSWGVMHAINDAFQGSKPATAVHQAWESERARFPQGTLHMRVADDHDELRLIARVGERAALAAQTLVFTMDGIPLVYNGMEAGDTAESAAPALFEKVPITWGLASKRPTFPRFYSKMSELRKNAAFTHGDLTWLSNSDEQRVLSYLRSNEKNEFAVVVNASGVPVTVTVNAPHDHWQDVTPDLSKDAAAPTRTAVSLKNIALEPWGFRILSRAEAN